MCLSAKILCPVCGNNGFSNVQLLINALIKLQAEVEKSSGIECNWTEANLQQYAKQLTSSEDASNINDCNEENDTENIERGLLSPSQQLNILQLSPNRNKHIEFQEKVSPSFSIDEKLKEEIKLPSPMTVDLSFHNINILEPENIVKQTTNDKINLSGTLSLYGKNLPISPTHCVPETSNLDGFLPVKSDFKIASPDFNSNENFLKLSKEQPILNQVNFQQNNSNTNLTNLFHHNILTNQKSSEITNLTIASKELNVQGLSFPTTTPQGVQSPFPSTSSTMHNKIFRRNRPNKLSKSTHQSVCETAVECNDCGLRFDNIRFLSLHKILLHSSKQNRVFQLKVYKCSHCSTEIENYEEFLEHLDKVHDDQRHVCKFCNKMFKLRGSLLVHQRVIHHNTTALDDITDHELKDEVKEEFGPGTPIPNNQLLITPLLKDGQNIPEKGEIVDVHQLQGSEKCCNMCTKSFTDNNEFVKHVKTHQDAKQFDCSVCYKKFTTKYFLKKHRRLHTGETPYTCNLCGKTFVFQQSYHKHMLYHTDEKPYSCSTCGRAFKELSTLQNHERIHTGERPFVCDYCGKSFRQRVSYLVHRRIHTGALPYICHFCGKKFRYKVTQRTHKCTGRVDMETEALSLNTTYSTISSPASIQSSSILPTNNSQVSFSVPARSFEQQQVLTDTREQETSAASNQQLLITPKSPQQILISEMTNYNKLSLNSKSNNQGMQPVKTDNNNIVQVPVVTSENVLVNDFIGIGGDQFVNTEDNKCTNLIELDNNHSCEEGQQISFQSINRNIIGGPLQFTQVPVLNTNASQNDILMRYRDPSCSKSPPYSNVIPSEIKKNLINFRRAQGKRRLGHRLHNILQRSKEKQEFAQLSHDNKTNRNSDINFLVQNAGFEPDLELLSISGNGSSTDQGDKMWVESPSLSASSCTTSISENITPLSRGDNNPNESPSQRLKCPDRIESLPDSCVSESYLVDSPCSPDNLDSLLEDCPSGQDNSSAVHEALLNFDISALQNTSNGINDDIFSQKHI